MALELDDDEAVIIVLIRQIKRQRTLHDRLRAKVEEEPWNKNLQIESAELGQYLSQEFNRLQGLVGTATGSQRRSLSGSERKRRKKARENGDTGDSPRQITDTRML